MAFCDDREPGSLPGREIPRNFRIPGGFPDEAALDKDAHAEWEVRGEQADLSVDVRFPQGVLEPELDGRKNLDRADELHVRGGERRGWGVAGEQGGPKEVGRRGWGDAGEQGGPKEVGA